MSHRTAQKSSYTVEMFIEALGAEHYEVLSQSESSIEIKVSNTQRYKLWLLELNLIDRVDYIVNGGLVHVSHYDESLNNVEDYVKES